MNSHLSDESVPKPWTKGIDQHGQPYYVNTETGQIRRQPPVTAGNQTYQKANAFIDPEQWDLVIETMASTIHPQQQLRIFQKLKKIAEKMITKDDPKYRTLYLNNPKLQHTVLAFDGGLEFLYNLGFEPHSVSRDKLICPQVNVRVVKACLICLGFKIESLSDDDVNINNNNNNHQMNLNQNQKDLIAEQQQLISQLNAQYSANNGFNHHHHQQQQQQQQQYNGNNDKEQVLANLGGLGFGNMIKNNVSHASQSYNPLNSNNSSPKMMSNPSDLLFRSKSDNVNNNFKNHNRPIPPPPMKQQIREQNEKNNQNSSKVNGLLGINQNNNNNLPKHRKMYKTFIFIRHGNSIWNHFKASGKKGKFAAMAIGFSEYLKTKSNPNKHADTWVVDAPLSRVGIDEAYGLSRFLGRHLTLRQFESLADLEHHQSLATPIKDALRIIQTGILDEYGHKLKQISPDLFDKCNQIKYIMEDAHKKIQRIMLETERQRGRDSQSSSLKKKALGLGAMHVTKGGDYLPSNNEKNEHKFVDFNNPSKNKHKNKNVLLEHGHKDIEDEDEKKKENSLNPELLRPFSHVVLHNQVEKVEETDELEMPLEMEWVLDQMIDSSNNSIVVTSNLRRAISTAVISLWDRFGANKECIHILPCLQELGMNVDTHTPILESSVPEVSNFEKTSKKLNVSKLTEFYSSRLVIEKENSFSGKKSLRESGQDTRQRLDFFCDWAFKKCDENNNPYNTIIACGHSHWMRSFFKTFLPKDTQSMAGKRKLQNCGVAGFRMICHIGPEDQRKYEVIAGSITPIYRGFV